MKNKLISFFAIFIVSLSAMAQRNEIFVSYGIAPQGIGEVPSSWKNIASLSSLKGYPYVHPTYSDKQTGSNSGAFSIGYMHKIVAGLSLGASYSYFTTNRNIMYDESDFKMNLADCSKKNHAILALAKYEWLSIGRFSIYSRAGIGVKISSNYTVNPDAEVYKGSDISTIPVFNDGKNKYAYVAYQILPICADFRVVPYVYIFAEGGYGSIGCFQCGVKTKF